jgi:hypothetical protein
VVPTSGRTIEKDETRSRQSNFEEKQTEEAKKKNAELEAQLVFRKKEATHIREHEIPYLVRQCELLKHYLHFFKLTL